MTQKNIYIYIFKKSAKPYAEFSSLRGSWGDLDTETASWVVSAALCPALSSNAA